MAMFSAVAFFLALTTGAHGFVAPSRSRFTTELASSYLEGLGSKQFSKPRLEIQTVAGTFVNETLRLQESDFPISPDDLIELAKRAIKVGLGLRDESILADDFEFCAPFVGPLNKKEFLGAVSSFKLLEAFPDLDNRYYNFHVDPFEYNRVWYMIRPLATHTGKLFGKKPTGNKLELPPQAQSISFDENGYVIDITVGYVMDRRVGNTGGLGGAFGLIYGAGQPLPIPECHPYKKSLRFRLVTLVGKIGRWLRKGDQ